MTSFMWGYGDPALFKHENLHRKTHDRIKDLFGSIGTGFFRQFRSMALKKRLLRWRIDGRYNTLPTDYTKAITLRQNIPATLLLSGKENLIFPLSNKRSYQYLSGHFKESEILYKEFEDYGHLDPFIGKNAYTDVFPFIFDFIKKHDRD